MRIAATYNQFIYLKKLSHHSWFVILQIPPQLCWGPNVMIWIFMCSLWWISDVSHCPLTRDAACIPSVKRIAIATPSLKICNMTLFIIVHIHIHSIIIIFGILLPNIRLIHTLIFEIPISLLVMNKYEFDWVYKYGDGYESLFSKIF